ncbi:MAG: YggS family pyridoxal phosphate-dependent enzyme [Firmicutes bacterium]|nr:YggS family pyridoxal phosphate-dependent enzyme [Bacillota bacterium]
MINNLIKQNIDKIKERIEKASKKAGRKPEDIKIIGVTKNVEPVRILKAIDAGIVDLGENRVQELQEKINTIRAANKNVNWHMIGHLQKNKVKYLIDSVVMIHSLDSVELAQEINKRAQKAGKIIDVLVQVNVAGEESKFGISKDEAMNFIKEISKYRNIKVKGLMTIAPLVSDPEEIRFVFKELRKIFIDISRENIDNIDMDYLSMGMSNDFEVAIEEGANIVRIGTAIFGKR